MRAMDMTAAQRSTAFNRHDRADEIIADYEGQHDFKLPVPWREAVSQLLLTGLSDPDLHLIFDTLTRVEYEAGRLPDQAPDYSAFKD